MTRKKQLKVTQAVRASAVAMVRVGGEEEETTTKSLTIILQFGS